MDKKKMIMSLQNAKTKDAIAYLLDMFHFVVYGSISHYGKILTTYNKAQISILRWKMIDDIENKGV